MKYVLKICACVNEWVSEAWVWVEFVFIVYTVNRCMGKEMYEVESTWHMENNGMNEVNKWNEKMVGFACTSRCFSWHRVCVAAVLLTQLMRIVFAWSAHMFSLLNKFRNIYMQIISQPSSFQPHHVCVCSTSSSRHFVYVLRPYFSVSFSFKMRLFFF